MQNSVATELTRKLQRLFVVVLTSETQAEGQAAIAEIEVLLPQWRQAVQGNQSSWT